MIKFVQRSQTMGGSRNGAQTLLDLPLVSGLHPKIANICACAFFSFDKIYNSLSIKNTFMYKKYNKRKFYILLNKDLFFY